MLTYICSLSIPAFAETHTTSIKQFTDVPKTSYAYGSILELRQLGVTNGIGNNLFGYGKLMTRGEFITYLVKLMGWKTVSPAKGSFQDNLDKRKPYFSAVETALVNGILNRSDVKFRPAENITREELIIMLVKSMGYGTLAERLTYLPKPFKDIVRNAGYVTIARDAGILNGNTDLFNPSGRIFKEQAAVMLVTLYHGLKRPLKDLNAFYAISSSSQQDKISDLSSVCFGWSSLSYDQSTGTVVVTTSRNVNGTTNDYYVPSGFTQRLVTAKEAGIPAMLMLQSTQNTKITDPVSGQTVGLPEYVLSKPEVYRKLITDLVSQAKSTTLGSETGSFNGIVIDMEGLKGSKLKQSFNDFLKELRVELNKENMLLYVAVQPLIHPKRSSASYDGYDYKTIGSLADKVILMAHDYDATRLSAADMARGFNITPLTPIEDVYYALEAITDSKTGVQDKSKIMLQVSFKWIVWKRQDGKVTNPVSDKFDLDNFLKLAGSGIPLTYQYSPEYANPYLKYTDPKTGTENTVWYENTQSVMEKIKLAKLFGIQGISLWRLGLIPDSGPDDAKIPAMDTWWKILNEMEKN